VNEGLPLKPGRYLASPNEVVPGRVLPLEGKGLFDGWECKVNTVLNDCEPILKAAFGIEGKAEDTVHNIRLTSSYAETILPVKIEEITFGCLHPGEMTMTLSMVAESIKELGQFINLRFKELGRVLGLRTKKVKSKLTRREKRRIRKRKLKNKRG
jgi:hypothetical protein